jgi:hypothetical protein
MTELEKIETTHEEQLDSTERKLSDDEVRHLGRTGVSTIEHGDSLKPPIDMELEGIEPAHYAPAGARPYEGSAKRGIDIPDSPEQEELASKYLSSLFPESKFSYLGAGRYGVVLADETEKAFKVYRSALSYSRFEKEAGALQLLSSAGLAPKLHLFVDAGKEYRLDRKAYNYTDFGFEDVQIPRQDSGRELPVLVMDKIDAGPLEDADPQQLVDGFCKVAGVFIKENIHAWDTEVMVDKATGKIIILDVGELSQQPFDKSSATLEAKLGNDQKILSGLILDFGLSDRAGNVHAAYKQGGLDAVRDYLMQLAHKA